MDAGNAHNAGCHDEVQVLQKELEAMSPEIYALIALTGADPATITDPYGRLRGVIAERDALRRQMAILRDGVAGACQDSGVRLSADRAFAEEMRR